MEKFKKIAIILIVCIAILITILLIALKKEKKDIQNEEFGSYENGADQINLSDNIEEVVNPTAYYTVSELMENYLKLISSKIDNNEEYIEGGEISFSELNGIYTLEEKNKCIYNLLDINYIKEQNINVNNINKFIIDIQTADNYKINKMYQIEGEKISYYLLNINVDNFKNLNYRIILDSENNTYMIKPLKDGNIDDFSISDIKENNLEKIDENEDNIFEFNRLENQEIAKKYFYDFKNEIFYNVEASYYLLEKDYREKRFGRLESYIAYVNQNEENISNLTIKQFLINNYDDYTEYVCKDQYENMYIFKAKAVMNYELQLDTYTITTDKFKESYFVANEEEKVKMNIDKFRDMLNRQDYRTSYSYISEAFRNNYFPTQNDFEQYIKNNFYNYNRLAFKKIEKRGSNLYVCNLEVNDLTEENSETKNVNVIIKLGDDLNFEIAFEM